MCAHLRVSVIWETWGWARLQDTLDSALRRNLLDQGVTALYSYAGIVWGEINQRFFFFLKSLSLSVHALDHVTVTSFFDASLENTKDNRTRLNNKFQQQHFHGSIDSWFKNALYSWCWLFRLSIAGVFPKHIIWMLMVQEMVSGRKQKMPLFLSYFPLMVSHPGFYINESDIQVKKIS